jgi:hypothetical protein
MMGESSGQYVYHGTPCVFCRSQNNRISILNSPAHETGYQFVYRGTLGVFCRIQNNRSTILSLLAREPAIEKVAKHGMGKRLVELMI